MTSSTESGDGDEWDLDVSALRARVRRDRRATSIPLLLLGAASTAGIAWQFPADDVIDGWTALLMTLAFAAIWLVFRYRAARAGVGRSAGFGAASLLGLLLAATFVGFFALAYAGPFLLFGLGLLVAASWQRNAFLAGWAVVVGGIGVFEGFFGITNRLPLSLWASWEHQAIYLVLAAVTMLAGGVAWLLENRGA